MHRITAPVGFRTSIRWLLAVVVVYRVYSLDVVPAISNDSLWYLTHTNSTLFSEPSLILRPEGTKTSGVPLVWMAVRSLANGASLDPLTAIALAHRVLLAGALGWFVLAFGAWSLPVALFLSSTMVVAHMNWLLAEGVNVPCAIIFALSLAALYRRRADRDWWRRTRSWLLLVTLTLSYSIVILTKTPYVVLALPVLAVGLQTSVRLSTRTRVLRCSRKGVRLAVPFGKHSITLRCLPTRLWLPALGLVALTAFYTGAVAVNYKVRYGNLTLSPSTYYSYYWQVWNRAFLWNANNAQASALAEFYDGGNVWGFSSGLFKANGYYNYPVNEPLLNERCEQIAAAANLPLAQERLRSFLLGFLVGGEHSDLGSATDTALARFHVAIFAAGYSDAAEKLFNEHNQGRVPRGLMGLAPPPQPSHPPRWITKATRGLIGRKNGLNHMQDAATDNRFMQAGVTLALLLGLAWSVGTRRLRWSTPQALAVVAYATMVAAYALHLADIWRYIIPIWAAMAVLVSDGMRSAVGRARRD